MYQGHYPTRLKLQVRLADIYCDLIQIQREAIQAVEQDGIVFIDEIDKVVTSPDMRYGKPV